MLKLLLLEKLKPLNVIVKETCLRLLYERQEQFAFSCFLITAVSLISSG